MALIKFRLPFDLVNRLIVEEYLSPDVSDDTELSHWLACRLGVVITRSGQHFDAYVPEEQAVQFKLTWL